MLPPRPNPSGPNRNLPWRPTAGSTKSPIACNLAAINVVSQAFTMNAAGGIEHLSTQKNASLVGKIDYDWQQLGPLLKPYLGGGVTIVGKHSRKFSVQGPLGELAGSGDMATRLASAKMSKSKKAADADTFAFLRPLVADVSLGWSRADVYGMRIGKLDFNSHLQDGTLGTQPIEATIGREDPQKSAAWQTKCFAGRAAIAQSRRVDDRQRHAARQCAAFRKTSATPG